MPTADLAPAACETGSRALEFFDVRRAEIRAAATFGAEDDFLRGIRRYPDEIPACPEG